MSMLEWVKHVTCKYDKTIIEHPNGYIGILYGKSSLAIYKAGKMVFHTGFRTTDNQKEIYDMLETFEDFINDLFIDRG